MYISIVLIFCALCTVLVYKHKLVLPANYSIYMPTAANASRSFETYCIVVIRNIFVVGLR